MGFRDLRDKIGIESPKKLPILTGAIFQKYLQQFQTGFLIYNNMKNTLEFLTELSEHNSKLWFDEHRKQYENCKKAFVTELENVIEQMANIDPIFETLEAKKTIFRINRDIRFSKDKSPYKNNFGAWFTAPGTEKAGYYLHLQPGNKTFVGGGIYMPPSDMLKKIRQEIDYNKEELDQILDAPAFKKLFPVVKGDQLTRPPKGYEESNPAIELLKHKSLVVSVNISDQEIIDGKLSQKTIEAFTVMKPFIQFLNRAFD